VENQEQEKKERKFQIEILEIQILSSKFDALSTIVLAMFCSIITTLLSMMVILPTEISRFGFTTVGIIVVSLTFIVIIPYAYHIRQINKSIEQLKEEYL